MPEPIWSLVHLSRTIFGHTCTILLAFNANHRQSQPHRDHSPVTCIATPPQRERALGLVLAVAASRSAPIVTTPTADSALKRPDGHTLRSWPLAPRRLRHSGQRAHDRQHDQAANLHRRDAGKPCRRQPPVVGLLQWMWSRTRSPAVEPWSTAFNASPRGP